MPRKRLDLPDRHCVSCRKTFKPHRRAQRFCRETCAQAWYAKQRKAILHESGMVTPRPHLAEKPWGWKRIGGRDVYIPKGERARLKEWMEEQL